MTDWRNPKEVEQWKDNFFKLQEEQLKQTNDRLVNMLDQKLKQVQEKEVVVAGDLNKVKLLASKIQEREKTVVKTELSLRER